MPKGMRFSSYFVLSKLVLYIATSVQILERKQSYMCTGGVLLLFALHFEVGRGSTSCQCAGEPVQQPTEEGRPLTQQRRGSDPCPVC